MSAAPPLYPDAPSANTQGPPRYGAGQPYTGPPYGGGGPVIIVQQEQQ
jgi:hypothetical protein